MKPTVLSTLTALAFCGAFAAAQAQTSSTDTAAQPATSTSTTTQGSASLSNRDAAQALEQAKKACKSETSPQAQQDCMKKAQDDYKASMKLRSDTKADTKADVKGDAKAETPKQ